MKPKPFFAGLLLAVFVSSAAAADYPSKPIRWIVGYPAGGGSDFIARVVGHALEAQTGQSVIVDNKPGAGANLGADAAAKAAPDGYTIFNADNGVLINNRYFYKKLPYDAERDLRTVSLLVRAPLLLVVPADGPQTFEAFLASNRNNPKGIVYGSPGNGTPHHLAMESLKQRAGLQMIHAPYRGAAPAVTDLVSGQIQAMMLDYATARGFLESGKLRALGVASTKRLPGLPNVPTMSEAGLAGFEAVLFVGVVTASKTPDAVVDRLSIELAKAVRTPEVSRKLSEAGLEPVGSTSLEFQSVVRQTDAQWAPLIRSMNLVLD